MNHRIGSKSDVGQRICLFTHVDILVRRGILRRKCKQALGLQGLPARGQATKQTTVQCSIVRRRQNVPVVTETQRMTDVRIIW